MWSVGWARGVLMSMEERGMSLRSAYPAEPSSMLCITRRGGRQRVWNEIEALLIEVGDGIEEH